MLNLVVTPQKQTNREMEVNAIDVVSVPPVSTNRAKLMIDTKYGVASQAAEEIMFQIT